MISQRVRDELFSFLTEDFNIFLNTVDESFFASSPRRRQQALDLLTEKHSTAIKITVKLFTTGSYHELSTRLYRLAKAFGKPKLLIIQSATTPSTEQRDGMIHALTETYPQAIIQQRVSPELYGGMRLFLDGTLLDETWNGTLGKLMQSIQQRLYVS